MTSSLPVSLASYSEALQACLPAWVSQELQELRAELLRVSATRSGLYDENPFSLFDDPGKREHWQRLRAYALWEKRGRPLWDHCVDWAEAGRDLRDLRCKVVEVWQDRPWGDQTCGEAADDGSCDTGAGQDSSGFVCIEDTAPLGAGQNGRGVLVMIRVGHIRDNVKDCKVADVQAEGLESLSLDRCENACEWKSVLDDLDRRLVNRHPMLSAERELCFVGEEFSTGLRTFSEEVKASSLGRLDLVYDEAGRRRLEEQQVRGGRGKISVAELLQCVEKRTSPQAFLDSKQTHR